VKESQKSAPETGGNAEKTQKLLPVSGSFFLVLRFSGANILLGVLPLLPRPDFSGVCNSFGCRQLFFKRRHLQKSSCYAVSGRAAVRRSPAFLFIFSCVKNTADDPLLGKPVYLQAICSEDNGIPSFPKGCNFISESALCRFLSA
jgi:hypothetical protein